MRYGITIGGKMIRREDAITAVETVCRDHRPLLRAGRAGDLRARGRLAELVLAALPSAVRESPTMRHVAKWRLLRYLNRSAIEQLGELAP